MGLRPGYKQTEVGVIPEDWEVKTLQDGIKLLSGHHVLTKHCNTDGAGVPYITGPADFSNGIIQHSKFTEKPTTTCRANDILVTVKGSGSGMMILSDAGYCISRQLMAVRVIDWDTSYIYSSLLQNKSLFAAAATGLIPGLSRGDILKKQIALPPLPEQHAIAAALNDADSLINGLDQLIAKKRDIKQAAMQQILTGKQRLPRFSGEWEVKRLVEIGDTYGGLTGKTKTDFGNGSAQYIPFLNVISNVVIDPNNLELVRVGVSESQNLAKKGDLFFNGSSETPEEVGMCAVLLENFQNVYLNSFCFGFRLREAIEADGLFLAYFFRSGEGRALLYSLAQGATRYNLSKTNFLKLEIPFPKPKEQTAIATVLSDMDAEIAVLEEKRNKTLDLKQGMMQELLTGRIRLI